MPRPDEGLIHAWLDGQLPPDEAARVEQLAATDAEWAAAVAEARGLMAASSRILSALDYVPADVIPKETARAARRLPWWTRVAAMLVVVAGTSVVVLQRSSAPELAPVTKAEPDVPAATSEVAKTTTTTTTTTAQPGAPTRLRSAPVPAPRLDGVQARRQTPLGGGAAQAHDVPVRSQPSAPTQSVQAAAEAESRREVRGVASTQAQATSVPANTQAQVASVLTNAQASQVQRLAKDDSTRGFAQERADAVNLLRDAQRKDVLAQRVSAEAPRAKTLAVGAVAAPANAPVPTAASGVAGGISSAKSASRVPCYRVRQDSTSDETGVVMRLVRTNGDTLRLEPAQGQSSLRAWVVWRDGTGHGQMTPNADGRGAVAVTALPVACPAP